MIKQGNLQQSGLYLTSTFRKCVLDRGSREQGVRLVSGSCAGRRSSWQSARSVRRRGWKGGSRVWGRHASLTLCSEEPLGLNAGKTHDRIYF